LYLFTLVYSNLVMRKTSIILAIILFYSAPSFAQWARLFKVFWHESADKEMIIAIEKLVRESKATQEAAALRAARNERVVLTERTLVFDNRTGSWRVPVIIDRSASIDIYGNKVSEADALMFYSEADKSTFMYVSDWGVIDGKTAGEQLAAYEKLIDDFKVRYHAKDISGENSTFKSFTIKLAARKLLTDFGKVPINDVELPLAIMAFQKNYGRKITGNLDGPTVKLLKRLTPGSIRNEMLDELTSTSINPRLLSDPINSTRRYFVNDMLKSNYYARPVSLLQMQKSGSNGLSAMDRSLLSYLNKNRFIPADEKLCSNLVVEKGLFKFQNQEKLALTGELDNSTKYRILEKSSSIDAGTFLPNYESHVNYNDLKVANSIVIKPLDLPHDLKLARYSGSGYLSRELKEGNFILVNEPEYAVIKYKEEAITAIGNFLNKLSGDITNYPETAVALSLNIRSEETICTLYIKNGRIVGYLHPLNKPLPLQFADDLVYIKDHGYKFLWAGDEIKSIDIIADADKAGVSTLRRISYVETKIGALNVMDSPVFDAQNAVVCNAIPYTKEQLKAGGFSALDVDGWVNLRNTADRIINGRFGQTLVDAKELKNEIINGEKDILTIVAHSDGMTFYIGTEAINIEQIKNWENRAASLTKKRNAVLLICDAGNVKITKGIFRKRVASISEILLNKGYFNSIIAPNREIDDKEVLQLLKSITKGDKAIDFRKNFKGWNEYVTLFNKYNLQYLTSL